ncbi:hypothetical protein EDB89DRAFT_1911128 [Lactarius sanguifluus]|nr:hypothetical protein EDB89DRAFT_1911128 [Lactarius sanguifluus]
MCGVVSDQMLGVNSKVAVTAQPGRSQRDYWEDAQDDAKWAREVRGATAVLERLLESGEYPTDHMKVGRLVSYIGHHVTPARDLPRTVRKSLDELAPRLRLEFIADASYLIIIDVIIAFALVGHALRIALAVAHGILKTFEHAQQQQTGI